MKILSVHFKNLNSLSGDWYIDFTHPDYVDCGIFAITGPTGAGKTTILDAICLALYGETPRLSSLTQKTNDIMTRGTSECSTEVCFETNQGRYRVTWQQRRARKKADGLLQAPRHELVDADTGAILASKLSEVSQRVDEITGMNFDRFTRSVLLAQGKFASFLQSNTNDRAPILEHITGTGIYSSISIAVFDRCKQANEVLERLQTETAGIEILSPERLELLHSEIAEKEKVISDTKRQLEQLDLLILWLQQLAQLHAQLHQDEKNQKDVANETLAFEPKKLRLHRDALASQLDVPYSELCGLRSESDSAKKEAIRVQEQLQQLESIKLDKQQLHDHLAREWSEKRSKRDEQEPVIREVRILDGDLSRRRDHVKQLWNELNTEKTRLQRVASNLSDHQTKLANAKQQQKRLDDYLKRHPQDANLLEQFSGIEADVRSWQNHYEELTKKRYECDEEQRELEAAEKRVSREINALQAKQVALEKAELACDQGRESLSKILRDKLMREYESERDHLLEQKRLRSIIQSLETHRAALKPGEACPLCGATEHPFTSEGIPAAAELDHEILNVVKRINDARTQVELNLELQSTAQAAQSECRLASVQVENEKLRLETLKKQIQTMRDGIQLAENKLTAQHDELRTRLAPYGYKDLPTQHDANLLEQLKQRRDRWQDYQSERQKSESHIAQVETDIQRDEATATEIQGHIQARTLEIQEKEQAIDEQVARRRNLFSDMDPDQESARWQKEIDTLEKSTAAASQRVQEANTEYAAASATRSLLVDRVTTSAKKLEDLEPAFREKLRGLGFADEDELKNSRLPDEVRREWNQTQMQLEKRQHAIAESLAEKRTRLQEENGRQLTQIPLEELLATRQERETNREENLRCLGDLQSQWKRHCENESRAAENAQVIAKQQAECERWTQLNHLIGSADGKKYRNFVQSLTFERLVHFANQQLASMSDRYLLVPDKEIPLTLNVIDNYQAGEIRTTKNLSGGETFIVSLALALGLSRLASHKVRVDSLFLDEGFGTLDEDALDIALDTLSSLHQDGKLIGVISHVAALNERISTKIKVSPKGSGRSVLSGPGCSRRPIA